MTGTAQAASPTASSATQWHAMPPEAVVAELGSDAERGLTCEQGLTRLAQYGPNLLRIRKPSPWWHELFEDLGEPLQLLLIAVGIVYFCIGQLADGITILAIIVAVSFIEMLNEVRAKRAIVSLLSLTSPTAVVLRGGAPAEAAAQDLVPGDVVLLGPGDRVPADLRIIEAAALRIDESSLTGESVPAAKAADAVLPAGIEIADRCTMAYASTLVTAGRGRGLVVATGRSTELGRVAALSEKAKPPRTPLQLAMKDLSRWLAWVAVGFSVIIPVLGWLVAGRPVREMILTGLTLAFATVPEELPILVTIVLGISAYRLAQRHAIVKHLRAAETLGSVSVVATDKTGTLTENRMRAALIVVDGKEVDLRTAASVAPARRLLEVCVLANDAQAASSGPGLEFIGDPTEAALLAAAQEAGLDVEEIRRSASSLDEYPFDDERKRMSVIVDEGGRRMLALKGAPEPVLAVCTHVRTQAGDCPLDDAERAALQARVEALAGRGLRVLAGAERALDRSAPPGGAAELVEQGMAFLGLIALEDPPRAEAAGAVAALQGAGVRVLMVTGDHPATARAIAERVGIAASRIVRGRDMEGLADEELAQLARAASVFARIAPEHKLRLVRALETDGEVVAVTGDGVNDAPALRQAAIGIAMGDAGADVAREAADLILADDNFATVTEAVRTGRVLFGNLSGAIRYYLAAKVALVLSALVAVLLKLAVPFAPIQIIVMELFMDLGASVTFVAEPPEADVMTQPPRNPRVPFMDRSMQFGILAGGLSLGAAVLVAYLVAIARGNSIPQAQTAAFVSWMIGHVVLAAHMRARRQPLLRQSPMANRPFLVWAAAAVALVAASVLVGPVRQRLHVHAFQPSLWPIVLCAALLLPSWWEVWKWARLRAIERNRVRL